MSTTTVSCTIDNSRSAAALKRHLMERLLSTRRTHAIDAKLPFRMPA